MNDKKNISTEESDIIDLIEEKNWDGTSWVISEQTEKLASSVDSNVKNIIDNNWAKDLIVINKTDIPEEYILSEIVKYLVWLNYNFDDFWGKISSLSLNELKNFNGNILNPNDMNRAILRTFKLINLWLENAVSIKEIHEDKVKLAKAIFTQKSLELIHQAWKLYFEKDKKIVEKVIKESEIEIGGLWFRLISKQEIDNLKKFTSVDTIIGTYNEYKNDVEWIQKILNKFKLTPLLSIKYCLWNQKHWWSTKKWQYITDFGVIDNILMSLTIACMFREEEDFFVDRKNTANLRRIYNQSRETLRQWWSINSSVLDNISYLTRYLEEEKKYRSSNYDNQAAQHVFLTEILKLEIEEIRKFSDAILNEKEFAKKLFSIKNVLIEYFLVARKTLFLKKSDSYSKITREEKIELEKMELKELNNIVVDIYLYTIQDIVKEIKEFYKTEPNKSIFDIEILKFWDQRVIINENELQKFSKNKDDLRMNVITENVLKKTVFNVEKILWMSTKQIINITTNFSSWDEENKKSFCEKFNPNSIILRDRNSINLVKILKNLSDLSTTWLGEKNINSNHLNKKEQILNSENPLIIKTKNWAEMILNKIAWSYTDPYIIAEIWSLWSDQIRDYIFSKKYDIKISIPALKHYYILEHKDTRLLNYILQKLINEDKLKPSSKSIWEDLLRISDYMPNARKIIEEKYNQIQKKK